MSLLKKVLKKGNLLKKATKKAAQKSQLTIIYFVCAVWVMMSEDSCSLITFHSVESWMRAALISGIFCLRSIWMQMSEYLYFFCTFYNSLVTFH